MEQNLRTTEPPTATPSWALPTTWAIGLIVALAVARFAVAGFVPLAFDEAYYWRWSTHLALGYLDHPPMIAWLIRIGTAIAGDNEFGVRLLPLLGGVAATWALWRAALLLLENRSLALVATLFFSLMLILSVGTILATPDAPLIVCAAFLLYFIAKLIRTGEPYWWLAAGFVTGLGCLSKYTALFWIASIFIWLVLDPAARKWLRTPWPWLGAGLALLVFAPNIIWNAQHDWMTFEKQFGRVQASGFTPGFAVEHVGTEIGMATPILFVLAWAGMVAFLMRRGGSQTLRILIGALVWPSTLYFIYHSFHARVEGNWSGPIFPALAIAATAAALTIPWRGWADTAMRILRPLAVPVGVVLVAAIYLQSLFGLVPLPSWDPTETRLGTGMEDLAREIDAIRVAEGATLILTQDYGMTGWLSFYSPIQPAPVYQLNETGNPAEARLRWIQEPDLPDAWASGPYLMVLLASNSPAGMETELGPAIRRATVERRRGDDVIAAYDIYFIQRRSFAALSGGGEPAA